MNYQELQDAIKGYSHRSDLDAIIPTFIEQARQRIDTMLRVREQLVTATFTMTDNPYLLPDDFSEALEVSRAREGGGREQLNSVGRHQLNDWQFSTGASSFFYSIIGTEFELAPNGKGELIQLIYWKRELPWTTPDQTSPILDRYPSIYIQGALIELYDYTDNSKKQQEATQKFTADVESSNRAAAVAMASESPAMNGAAQL